MKPQCGACLRFSLLCLSLAPLPPSIEKRREKKKKRIYWHPVEKSIRRISSSVLSFVLGFWFLSVIWFSNAIFWVLPPGSPHGYKKGAGPQDFTHSSSFQALSRVISSASVVLNVLTSYPRESICRLYQTYLAMESLFSRTTYEHVSQNTVWEEWGQISSMISPQV